MDLLFTKIYTWVGKYRIPVLALLLLLAGVLSIRLLTVSFKSDIYLMLPAGSKVARDINFLQNSSFSNKVVISLKGNGRTSLQDLISASDMLSKELKSPLFTEVINGTGDENYAQEMQKMLSYAPQLIGAKELFFAQKRITGEGVKSALSRIYRQLALSPSASFVSSFARSDPLGIRTPLLKSLQNLNRALGYKIDVVDGHFISKDGKHLLMILSTPVKITDIKGSKKLIGYLNRKLIALPGNISASIICGHLHSISNEQVMKKDVMVIMSIASFLFFLLFIFWFRSIRATLLFIMPFLGIIISAGLCSLFISDLALFVIGMGGVLAGIAIDYGIHVYVAVSVGGNNVEHVRKVYRPIMVGALTTIGVLASFFLSRVEGYHQLAFFSVVSLIICVLCSVFLLPHFFRKGERYKSGYSGRSGSGGPRLDVVLLALWVVFIGVTGFYGAKLKFNNDIVQFDGSRPEIFQAEEAFHRTWGREDQTAILVAQGRTLEKALKLNEQLYSASEKNRIGLSSIAPLWPSRSTRKKNADNWVKFWQGGAETKLRKLINKHSPAYGFSRDAFEPFFQDLYKNVEVKGDHPQFMEDVIKRFIVKTNFGYRILSFFPDTARNVKEMNMICSNFPESFIVSRKSISGLLSSTLFDEILYMSIVAAIVIPFLTIVFLRKIVLSLIALIPVVSGMLGILGIFSMVGMSINAPSVIASIVVLGLCIDYGIFMVYSLQTKRKTGTKIAVILSALTTFMGAGGLLFAKHPMLYYVGFTVTIGILCGAISAILIVPAIYRKVGH